MHTLTRLSAKSRTWLPQAGPRALAVLRIVTGYFAFRIGLARWDFEPPPPNLRVPPPGTAWLDFLPVNDLAISLAAGALAAAALFLVLGWRPTWTASLAAIAFFYVGWVTTLSGKVDHSHHLLWVLVVLAVSPCANTWAVRREDREGSYQWAVFAVIVMIGLIYFGAGLQKLLTTGLAWGWSENLMNTMLNQAWEKSREVPWWLVEFPVLGKVLGTAALLFELSFLPLLLYPRTRRWVWPAGLLFHWATWFILGISFLSLQAMYVVFLPWDKSSHQKRVMPAQRRVLTVLVASVAIFSVSGVDAAWPVAAYPGFGHIQDHYFVDYEVVNDGETTFLTDASLPVPPWHVQALVEVNAREGRIQELIDWLGIDALYRVTIDSLAGEVIDRTRLG